jgi:hypothetical protein
MKFEVARAGVSPRLNSALLAEEYRNVTTRALNLDGGGGFDTPALSTSLTLEGRARNAALAASLGIGDDIRAMAAQGRTTRQIAEGLCDRLAPVNRQAQRIGQGGDAGLHRMAVVQAFKDEHGIPNPDAAGFRSWAAAERTASSAPDAAATGQQTPSAVERAPAWARNARYRGPMALRVPANLNMMIPRGTDRSAGMNASNTGARE